MNKKGISSVIVILIALGGIIICGVIYSQMQKESILSVLTPAQNSSSTTAVGTESSGKTPTPTQIIKEASLRTAGSELKIRGCIYPGASNYNPKANIDDKSCIFPAKNTRENTKGCTNPQAINYNNKANEDDGSCKYQASNLYTRPAFTPIPILTPTPTPVATPPSAQECNDPDAINYNPYAKTSVSCRYLSGCTDSRATNYNSKAKYNDGSCKYPVPESYDLYLQRENVVIAPSEIKINEPMTITVYAQNGGNTAISSFQAALFIDDQIIVNKTDGRITAQSQADNPIIFTYTPAEAQYGSRRLKILLDPNNNFAEYNESNNGITIEFQVTGLMPDFVLSNYQLFYSETIKGYAAKVTLTNQGEKSYIGAIDLALYVDNQKNTTLSVQNLNAGESKNITGFQWIPPPYSGNHNVKIAVDPSNAIMESNENNNETETITAGAIN